MPADLLLGLTGGRLPAALPGVLGPVCHLCIALVYPRLSKPCPAEVCPVLPCNMSDSLLRFPLLGELQLLTITNVYTSCKCDHHQTQLSMQQCKQAYPLNYEYMVLHPCVLLSWHPNHAHHHTICKCDSGTASMVARIKGVQLLQGDLPDSSALPIIITCDPAGI